MDPHRKLGIYVGYLSPSIIKYLEPLTGDLFTAEYADCMFNEDHFPVLGEEFKYHTECQEINWDSIDTLKMDPRTKETELQVQRIIELQHITNNLPDAFTNTKGVTKSSFPARNVAERIEIPNKTIHLSSHEEKGISTANPKAVTSRKRTRKQMNEPSEPANAAQPQVERHQGNIPNPHSTSMHSNHDDGTSEHPDNVVLGNTEQSEEVQEITNYVYSGESYNKKTTIVDVYFATSIADNLQKDPNPKSMAECKKHSNWNKWKEAIETELASLTKREVFSSVIPTLPKTFPMGFKWVFVQKRNENNEVVRYKARLVAQGFTQ